MCCFQAGTLSTQRRATAGAPGAAVRDSRKLQICRLKSLKTPRALHDRDETCSPALSPGWREKGMCIDTQKEALRAGESNKGPAKNPSKIQKNLPQTLTLPTARAHTSCKAGSTLCLRSLRRGGDLSHTCTVRKL